MSERDEELPHLDHRIRFAIQAFRQVKPSPALEQRLWDALDAQGEAPEKARGISKPEPRSFLFTRAVIVAMVGLLLVSIYALKLAGHWGHAPSDAPTELAVSIPDEGYAWVELPVSASLHRPAATVYIDTLASVPLRLTSASEKAHEPHTVCTEHRCVHRFSPVASSKTRAIPHVRISEPGRYELTVTHVSPGTNRHQRIVVHARR